MEIKRKGVTRIVFIFDRFVIKIPNFLVQHNHFLHGCLANWNERYFYKRWNKTQFKLLNKAVPSIFCSWFGLLQIQRKCKPLDRELTNEEIELYKDLHNGDCKKENFGYYNGQLVCLDYGN
jgi:hypothetical protein